MTYLRALLQRLMLYKEFSAEWSNPILVEVRWRVGFRISMRSLSRIRQHLQVFKKNKLS